ncbi:MAG: hypothetical protein IPO53_14890 [Chitinophagaceae bacterium]|nr:hypothetical protein [Chitinophagaceae bacterium]
MLPYKRNEEIKKLLIEKELFVQQLTFIRQSVNHDYFRIILSGKLKTATQTETRIDEISIKDGNDQYTPGICKFTERLLSSFVNQPNSEL